MSDEPAVRHRTNDLHGQNNGRPLTIDNDRADALSRAWMNPRRTIRYDFDEYEQMQYAWERASGRAPTTTT